MTNATDFKIINGVPVEAPEKSHVLNLHRGQKAVASPAIGLGDSLPDQPFADLVEAPVIGVHT